MKALNAFVLVLLLSSAAQADYFFCQLKVDYLPPVTVEAEYRVLEASVTQRPFKCSGRVIPGTRNIEVKIESTETDDKEKAVSNGTTTVEMYGLDVHGDGQDFGSCTCGMQ